MNDLQTWIDNHYTNDYRNQVKNILLDYFERGKGLINTDQGIHGKELILKDFFQLELVRMRGNYLKTPLTKLIVSNCPNLKHLDLKNNQLTTLELDSLPNLKTLNVNYNQLKELNISNCPNLTELEASYNQLTTLYLSSNTQLKELDLSYNPITKIDFLTTLPNLDKLKILKIKSSIKPLENNIFWSLPLNIQNTLQAYQKNKIVSTFTPPITPPISPEFSSKIKKLENQILEYLKDWKIRLELFSIEKNKKELVERIIADFKNPLIDNYWKVQNISDLVNKYNESEIPLKLKEILNEWINLISISNFDLEENNLTLKNMEFILKNLEKENWKFN